MLPDIALPNVQGKACLAGMIECNNTVVSDSNNGCLHAMSLLIVVDDIAEALLLMLCISVLQ